VGNAVKKRVFLVAGDAHNLSVKETLQNQQYDVLCFATAEHCGLAILKQPPDVLIITPDSKNTEHVELLKKCRETFPFLPILAVVENNDIAIAIQATKAGANEILEKPFTREKVRKAVEFVSKTHSIENGDPTAQKNLTDVEKTVLRLILMGHSSKDIAKKLNRSARTVEDHRSKIMRKIGVDSLIDLAKYAIQTQLI
jgi:two-component system, LuxR family, response regulator FixJ